MAIEVKLKHIIISFILASYFLVSSGVCSVKYKNININGVPFKLEVADSQEERETGLSGRVLKQNEGMLFVFERPCRPAFWMKGVLEPLDIVWIDDEKKVVGVLERLPVCRGDDCDIYRPSSKICYAIELKGGISGALKLKTGQVLDI